MDFSKLMSLFRQVRDSWDKVLGHCNMCGYVVKDVESREFKRHGVCYGCYCELLGGDDM